MLEMTKEEEILWRCLRRNQLGGYHFRRQQVIFGFIADFYCHAVGVVVEIDGEVHWNLKDRDRQGGQLMIEHGLAILRITNEEVRNDLRSVLKKIAQICNERSCFPGREVRQRG